MSVGFISANGWLGKAVFRKACRAQEIAKTVRMARRTIPDFGLERAVNVRFLHDLNKHVLSLSLDRFMAFIISTA